MISFPLETCVSTGNSPCEVICLAADSCWWLQTRVEDDKSEKTPRDDGVGEDLTARPDRLIPRNFSLRRHARETPGDRGKLRITRNRQDADKDRGLWR